MSEIELQEVAKQHFLTLRRVLSAYKKGQYTDENVLNFFAGFCGYIPKEEDLKLKSENKAVAEEKAEG